MDRHRELLGAIEREFTQLGYRWAMFLQLFDSGQDNVDLLNKSGSNVFELLQKLIIDDVMMSLCRLTDPPKSMGYENASLEHLVGKLQEELPLAGGHDKIRTFGHRVGCRQPYQEDEVDESHRKFL